MSKKKYIFYLTQDNLNQFQAALRLISSQQLSYNALVLVGYILGRENLDDVLYFYNIAKSIPTDKPGGENTHVFRPRIDKDLIMNISQEFYKRLAEVPQHSEMKVLENRLILSYLFLGVSFFSEFDMLVNKKQRNAHPRKNKDEDTGDQREALKSLRGMFA
jgi:hypothetical protein